MPSPFIFFAVLAQVPLNGDGGLQDFLYSVRARVGLDYGGTRRQQ